MRYDQSSGLIFLQRLGLVEADRQPWPPQDTRALIAHRLSLTNVTPLPQQLSAYEGDPAPDRGQTYEWPAEL